VLCVAAVVAAAPGHEKDPPSTSGAPFGTLQLLVEHSHAGMVVSREHLSNWHARDGSCSDARNSFFPRLLFGIELYVRDRNDFGVFEHARS
jgi:hypothetical protein